MPAHGSRAGNWCCGACGCKANMHWYTWCKHCGRQWTGVGEYQDNQSGAKGVWGARQSALPGAGDLGSAPGTWSASNYRSSGIPGSTKGELNSVIQFLEANSDFEAASKYREKLRALEQPPKL
eukprot:1568110-Pyramimonas_sp.AAC.1